MVQVWDMSHGTEVAEDEQWAAFWDANCGVHAFFYI